MGRPKKQNREPFWRSERNCWYVQNGTTQVRLSPDKDEAWRLWHEFMARPPEQQEAAASSGPDAHAVSVLDAFLDWCQKHKAGRTYDWYLNYLESFARSLPSGLTVAKLKPFHVQQWIDGNPTWKTGQRGAIIAVQRAFNWAVRMGLIASNPVRSLEKPKAGRREHVISDEQFKLIISLIRDLEFRDLLTVCWETGCRPQEVLSVETSHVNAADGCWVFPVDESKGKERQRIVYLTNTALEITKRRMAGRHFGPLFLNTDGLPWTASALNCRFSRLRLALGRKKAEELGLTPPKIKRLTKAQRIDGMVRQKHLDAMHERQREIAATGRRIVPRYSLYTFRHSWCTHALERGVDAVTVAVLMGHRDTTMISRVYAHLMQRRDHLRDAVKKAAGA
jgi:integrase